jgi:hypothetical protein
MNNERPILKLPKKAEALRMQALRDKCLDLAEEITQGAIEVAKQGKSAKEYVEAISMLNELVGKSEK